MTSVFQEFKISCFNSILRGPSAQSSDGHPWRNWQVTLVAMEGGKEVKGKASLILDHVEYILHPTFESPRRIMKKEPYHLQEKGWGEFDLRALLHFTDNLATPKIIVFDLNFAQSNYSVVEKIEFPNASSELVHLLSLKPSSVTASSTANIELPPPRTAHLPISRTPTSSVTSSTARHHSIAARQAPNHASSSSSSSRVSPTRKSNGPRRSSTSSKEAPSTSKPVSSANTTSKSSSSVSSFKDASPPSRNSRTGVSAKKPSSSGKVPASDDLMANASRPSDKPKSKSSMTRTQERPVYDSPISSPTQPSSSMAKKLDDSQTSETRRNPKISKSSRPVESLKSQPNIYLRPTHTHAAHVASKLHETHIPIASPSADQNNSSTSRAGPQTHSQIEDHVDNPLDAGLIHFVHSAHINPQIRADWDIPNVDMAQLSTRLTILQGAHRIEMQELIVANETEDMEFFIENGSVGFNLYSFGSHLIQTLWNFTDTIPYVHEVERNTRFNNLNTPQNAARASDFHLSDFELVSDEEEEERKPAEVSKRSSRPIDARRREPIQERSRARHREEANRSPKKSNQREDSSPRRSSYREDTSPRRHVQRQNSSPKRPIQRDESNQVRPVQREESSPRRLYQREESSPRKSSQRENSIPRRPSQRESSGQKRPSQRESSTSRKPYQRENSSPRRSYQREESSPRRPHLREESNSRKSRDDRSESPNRKSREEVNRKRLYQREESNQRAEGSNSRRLYQKEDSSPRKRKLEEDDVEQDSFQRSERPKIKSTKIRKH